MLKLVIYATDCGRLRRPIPMKIRRSQSGRLWTKRLATIIMAIWLSGANCLWCCGPMEKATPEAENCAASAVANNSAEELCNEGDCCTKSPEHSQQPQSKPCKDECCILNAPTSELPSGIQANQISAIVRPVVSCSELTEPAQTARLPFSQARLPDGQQTHLRCCVFLI